MHIKVKGIKTLNSLRLLKNGSANVRHALMERL